MMKQLSRMIFVSFLLGTSTMSAQAAVTNECKFIGGTGMANAINETNLVASLTGALAGGARAEITAQEETKTGLSLDMEHYFFNDKGGLLRTSDKATLTRIPGKPGTYMLEIAYEVVEANGAYAGYKGQFNSHGLINLETGKVVLRYAGDICK